MTNNNNNNNNSNNKSNNKIVRNLILIKSKRELKLTKRVIDLVFCFFPPGFSPHCRSSLVTYRLDVEIAVFVHVCEQSAQKLSGIV